jgi:lipoprotein-anchoring transpeptidase ErfK/SrfK
MKTKILSVILFIAALAQVCALEVSTFNGEFVHYGWSGKSFSEDAFKKAIDEEFNKNTPKLDIQQILDQKKISAELLWKIDGSIDEIAAFKTPVSSWIWSDAQVTSFRVVIDPSGRGYIHLYQDEVAVGRFRCSTSNKRTGDKYLQLKPGTYRVAEKEEQHRVTEEGLKGVVLKHALSSGVDGKWIHEGEYNVSHGCVRVSKPAMIEMYRRVEVSTPFVVTWSD